MRHKPKSGSPVYILMGHYCGGGRAGRYADGGMVEDRMAIPLDSRRSEPNVNQHFKRGGRAAGGQMQMEDALKAMGVYSPRGGEMEREDRRRSRGGAMHPRKGEHHHKHEKHHAHHPRRKHRDHYASGGDIGTNTGSSTARTPGHDAIGDGTNRGPMHRAMGGVGKTRKRYPFTR